MTYQDGCYRTVLETAAVGQVVQLKIAARDWRKSETFGGRLPETRVVAGHIVALARDADAGRRGAPNLWFRADAIGPHRISFEVGDSGVARLLIEPPP